MDNVENTVEEVELTAAEKLAQFEKEKLSRRQALARFGFQAGAAAVAALTADELLRKVGKEMQRRAGDNKVAQQVAREFQQAGVANAVAAESDPGNICLNCGCFFCPGGGNTAPPGYVYLPCNCPIWNGCTRCAFNCPGKAGEAPHDECCTTMFNQCNAAGGNSADCIAMQNKCLRVNE
ncbi:hypothetical protein [Armatimonas sp.]|uniref:hypothetical protein n=1 Tax=Armatimonas sp. TaxID=1872638 RepID=UPI0037519740